MLISSNSKILYLSAAACTFIAGILHLTLVPNAIDRNVNNGIFFLVAGLAQIFWVVPMIRQWGRGWYYVGIAGTLVLIIMWIITRIPGNPITGRGGPVSEIAIATEVFQVAFVVLSIIILSKERKKDLPLRNG
ncbi:MAG TPA: hypothetical protein VH415_06130 [Nitrososphaeraceae archaeon]